MHLLQSLLLLLPALGADLPAPPPPADFTLVKWPTVVDYFRKADAASDRVVVRELGKTTEGRPYLAAFVSSPETIAHLDRYRNMQQRLADPSAVPDPEVDAKLIADSKAVVLITCSIHSTETASTFMAMKLLHELATKDDPATRRVLDNTILILVPSANPDGVDIVADWYEHSRDKPWEGEGLPRLYHKYAGHDTNRDWFMLNLQETQLLTKLLYKEWFPTMAYDVHQMGSKGARMFVPPFFDPINPNLDARVNQSIAVIGADMAADLASEKKKGVLTNAMYDNWWNGGNRTTPQRHNIVAVLTEAASVKLGSPIFIDRDDLRGVTRGFSSHKPAVNFVDPWEGGWWRLADIESYERICARFAPHPRGQLQGPIPARLPGDGPRIDPQGATRAAVRLDRAWRSTRPGHGRHDGAHPERHGREGPSGQDNHRGRRPQLSGRKLGVDGVAAISGSPEGHDGASGISHAIVAQWRGRASLRRGGLDVAAPDGREGRDRESADCGRGCAGGSG